MIGSAGRILLVTLLISAAYGAGVTRWSAIGSPAGVIAFQGNSIGGFVFNSSRRPVPHIRVELLDEVDTVLSTTETGQSGRYVFRGLSSGNFQVRVLTHGTDFIAQTERVNIINFSRTTLSGGTTVSGSQYLQVDFTLHSKNESVATRPPVGTGVTFVQDVPDTARKSYEEAINVLNTGKDDERGLAKLREALDLFPSYYLALERLGTEYVRRKEYEPARQFLNKAVEVNPNGQLSMVSLAIAQYYLKQMPEAIDSLRRAISLGPDSVNANLWLGIVLLKDNKGDDQSDSRLQEAETHLKRAYELGGKRVPDVHMHLAQLYSNTGRYKEAADELELFLKEVPDAKDAQPIKEIIKQLRNKAQK